MNQLMTGHAQGHHSCRSREQSIRTSRSLPEQCRKIIRMTFEEGKNPKEIAEELGIGVGTVNSQKMRGLTLLKESFQTRIS